VRLQKGQQVKTQQAEPWALGALTAPISGLVAYSAATSARFTTLRAHLMPDEPARRLATV
jgi:hypothetical protein